MKTKILGLCLSVMACHSPSIFQDPAAVVAEVQQKYEPSETFQAATMDWSKAVQIVNRWGKVQVGVPLLQNPRHRSAEAGDFREYLILSTSGEEEFVVQILGNTAWESALKNYDKLNPPGFTGKLLKRDVNSEISSGYAFQDGKVIGKIFGNAVSLKNTRVSEEDCWEVVLITYYYDGTTTREHLYFVCFGGIDEEESGDQGGGSSSSGDSGSCTFDPNAFYAAAVSESESTEYEGNLERRKAYAWKAVMGPTYAIYSHEIGVHRRASVSDPWKWHSLTHATLSVVGFAPGVKINPSLNTAISTLGEYYANMSLSVNVMFSFVCSGTPLDTPRDFYPNMNFYVG